MKLANHCQLKFARAIIVLAKQGLSRSKISKELQISKGKMQRCLDYCEIKTNKPNRSQPWNPSLD